MKKWPEEHIIIDGNRCLASAPYIISASRATDIPAFYSDEFMRWLKRGWCWSINPFNSVKTRISFSKCRVLVFWSKNPFPILPLLSEIRKRYNLLFQFTLNDYDKEDFEKNVPPLEQRILTFKHLSTIVGKRNLIWRFDPILLSDTVGVDDIIKRFCEIGDQIHSSTQRLIFSFIKIDRYKRVSHHIQKSGHAIRELTEYEKREILEQVSAYNKARWGLQISSCGTPDLYRDLGIDTAGCISYDHINTLGIDDPEFNSFFEYDTPGLFALDPPRAILAQGQQPLCSCIQSKDVGRYNTCAHGCIYCYANRSFMPEIKTGLE